MKKMLLSLALAAAGLVSTLPAQAAALVFSATSTHINVGDSVTIEAKITGLGAQVLSAYDLNFIYSGSVLNWFSISQNLASFGPDYIGGAADLTDGNLDFYANSLMDDAYLMANQPDEFLLFSFTLNGMMNGSTMFTLGGDPDFERNFVGLEFQTMDVDVGSICIAVGDGACAVPEPGSYGLVGLALAGALVPAWRRRSGRPAN
ncbi:PEP-CTERM sorting domain-containing protein [Pelomonas sp. SE-A7]|uniref:PEP-CTERM sorting domain-containing protein n=1 Tax=Pelomonas sp. SE-A7 TaxID=3054953 RepID=UPI00259CB5A5|nr:PEP-CTERM sorting domain-containing protein [Pelomonas sp. SE-A7]MDM4766635.1 PEP-CTERM sorting domain-containing protein [Pelomonas sp. SE-A7]